MGSVTKLHYSIMEYWKDKCITKDGRVMTYEEAKRSDTDDYELVITDWGEPSCWACCVPARTWEEKHYEEWLENSDYKSIWNSCKTRHHLNRCHIISESLGGTSVPENLFLLCPRCHEDSPDTKNAGTFFRWVYRKRKNSCGGSPSTDILFSHIDEELKDRGLPGLYGIAEQIGMDGADSIRKKAAGPDGIRKAMSQNTGMHGYRIVESSIYGAIADWLEKEYNELVASK